MIILLSIVLSGCMAALDPVGNGAQQATGWPTAPAPTGQGPLLEEPVAPPTTAAQLVPTVTVGQLAPEPPTAVPSPVPVVPSSAAGEQPAVIIPALPNRTPEEIWRAQQADRNVFGELRFYTTTNATLWWFDPLTQQQVALGGFSGQFPAQAAFTLKGQAALEIPYKVNESYGLTALSPAILQRIQAAGFSDWIETYILVDANVQPL
jgi:hypothetical protein